MKVAIFSDVHGNIYSLKNTFESMKENKIESYIFCGDICGYYYHQNEIIDIFKNLKNFICILGNHDKKFLEMLNGKKMEYDKDIEKCDNSNRLLLQNITNENRIYLENLKEKYEGEFENKQIAIYHGSPFNYLNEYIYPTNDISKFENLDFDIIFLGHTHYPMYKKVENKIIINPGSCGQPRNGKLPSYVIWDTQTNRIEFKYIDYDCTKLVNEINIYDKTNDYLKEILYRRK